MRLLLPLIAVSALTLSGCDKRAAPQPKAKEQTEAEPDTVDIPQTVETLAPGTTPMPQRVAVIGLLNKRNGISRDLTMRPGQAMRVDDVIVRLRACETTAPWEIQQLTGAFVQVDVQNTENQFQRAFSGWVYKETPSLNVVEHPVYDVWPKSCTMTHPVAAGSAVRAGSDESSRSKAPNSPSRSSSTPESGNADANNPR